MALTLEQEKALIALLQEKRITLPELTAATEIANNDLLLVNQMLTDKSITAELLKNFIAPLGSTKDSGIVKLSNSVVSDTEKEAATSKAVKTANDNANERVLRSGDRMTGSLAVSDSLVVFSNPDLKRSHLFFKEDELADLEYASICANSEGSLIFRTGYTPEVLAKHTIIDKEGNFSVNGNNDIYPVGAPIPWPATILPSGFLKCNGATFDKEQYPALAKAYPSGVLPDLRGEFIRGWDDGRGIDRDRNILSSQVDTLQKITGEIDDFLCNVNANADGAFDMIDRGVVAGAYSGEIRAKDVFFDSSRVVRSSDETRPRNIAFLYIVRAA